MTPLETNIESTYASILPVEVIPGPDAMARQPAEGESKTVPFEEPPLPPTETPLKPETDEQIKDVPVQPAQGSAAEDPANQPRSGDEPPAQDEHSV
jgi:hypothetical protein